jgi:hypothetical protein
MPIKSAQFPKVVKVRVYPPMEIIVMEVVNQYCILLTGTRLIFLNINAINLSAPSRRS